MSEDLNFIEIYKDLFIFQVSYMTVAWILGIILKNGSMVDFAWPSGFFLMAIKFYIQGRGNNTRKLMIFIPYVVAGLRFMYGWTFKRKHYKYEDSRWNLWREKWKKGEGLFTIKNIQVNFFFFYHTQSLSNVFFMSLPLILISNNKDESIHLLEIVGLLLWIFGFIIENIADLQLSKFKRNKENKKNVMKSGLWKYSRHPNYFFEFILWISYSIMTIPSITEIWQYLILATLPIVAYIFLVHFTGVPMCEKQSIKNRGILYEYYQSETNMFFPWFPSKNYNKNST